VSLLARCRSVHFYIQNAPAFKVAEKCKTYQLYHEYRICSNQFCKVNLASPVQFREFPIRLLRVHRCEISSLNPKPICWKGPETKFYNKETTNPRLSPIPWKLYFYPDLDPELTNMLVTRLDSNNFKWFWLDFDCRGTWIESLPGWKNATRLYSNTYSTNVMETQGSVANVFQ